jgi:hypothetical protein
MSTHPEESLPAHNTNVTGSDSDDRGARRFALTVGSLRQSLRDLPADNPVLVNVESGRVPRPALYAHQGHSGQALIIEAPQLQLPRQLPEDQPG